GIGRRVRFRSVWGQPCEGSSPFARTILVIAGRKLFFGLRLFVLRAGYAKRAPKYLPYMSAFATHPLHSIIASSLELRERGPFFGGDERRHHQ
ncbi:MAG: hypothetical protein RR360_07365, partial [Raoultibacter sp.]